MSPLELTQRPVNDSPDASLVLVSRPQRRVEAWSSRRSDDPGQEDLSFALSSPHWRWREVTPGILTGEASEAQVPETGFQTQARLEAWASESPGEALLLPLQSHPQRDGPGHVVLYVVRQSPSRSERPVSMVVVVDVLQTVEAS